MAVAIKTITRAAIGMVTATTTIITIPVTTTIIGKTNSHNENGRCTTAPDQGAVCSYRPILFLSHQRHVPFVLSLFVLSEKALAICGLEGDSALL